MIVTPVEYLKPFDSYSIPTGNIVSYWNFDDNVLDQVGSNNGSTSITYTTGVVGNSGDFTGSTSLQVAVADDDTLSFGNGSTDSPFSVNFWVNWSSVGITFLFTKKNNNNTQREYQIEYGAISANILTFRVFDQSAGAYLEATASFTPSTSTWYMLTYTYDGSGIETGMNIYIDGSLSTTSQNISGTYTAMENGTATLIIGRYPAATTLSLNGYMDEISIFDIELSAAEVSDIYDKNQAGLYLTQ